MSDTQYKLQQRVQNYSSEAEVYQEGGNRINVDIPGVTDANKILEELGKPGSLQFYDENWNVVLEGTDVASAKAVIYKDQQTGNNNYEVALTFTDEGTKKFADVTAANVGKKIAIVYDNVMYSNPTVQQAITGGQASISGMTSYEEAENLASTIRIGSLSLELDHDKLKGRRDRFRNRMRIHDRSLPRPGSCGIPCTLPLCGIDADPARGL